MMLLHLFSSILCYFFSCVGTILCAQYLLSAHHVAFEPLIAFVPSVLAFACSFSTGSTETRDRQCLHLQGVANRGKGAAYINTGATNRSKVPSNRRKGATNGRKVATN